MRWVRTAIAHCSVPFVHLTLRPPTVQLLKISMDNQLILVLSDPDVDACHAKEYERATMPAATKDRNLGFFVFCVYSHCENNPRDETALRHRRRPRPHCHRDSFDILLVPRFEGNVNQELVVFILSRKGKEKKKKRRRGRRRRRKKKEKKKKKTKKKTTKKKKKEQTKKKRTGKQPKRTNKN